MTKRRWRWLAGLITLVLSVAVGVLAVDIVRFLHGPLKPEASEPIIFVIEPGTSLSEVSASLAQRGLIDRPLYFRAMARLREDARNIKAGHYAIDPDTTPYRLLTKFVRGDVRTFEITIIEGWTFAEMMRAIRAHDAIKHTLAGLLGTQIMAQLGHPDQYPEGLFYPDTYFFPYGTTDRALLKRMYQRMQTILAEEWAARAEGLPLDTPYEALILASIVEKETALARERPRVAGVFIERLERGMRLQADPTVIYGLGEKFHGNLRYEHLRMDTPYNTYTNFGLPPTPIALPSRESIHATLHPARRNELYFVATGNGGHVFSKTLEQHRKAVAKYQLSDDTSESTDKGDSESTEPSGSRAHDG